MTEKAPKKAPQEFEDHGDTTAPAGLQSPGTFIPLQTGASSVNSKSSEGLKGEE